MRIALTYAPGAFDFRDKVMGRQAAGVGFLRALAEAKLDSVGCYTASSQLAHQLGSDLSDFAVDPLRHHFIPFDRPQRLASFGLLYHADPNLGGEAWKRQQNASARAYSLCGVTHTLASAGAMQSVLTLLEAPLYPWDALICTSRVARDVALRLIEMRLDHLRRRLGVKLATLPQFPLIPLGVHVQDFAASEEVRTASRSALGLARDEVTVLFSGRLSFHAKAHPLPMFLGLQRASKASGKPVALLLFGQFSNAAVAEVFHAEAALFAPSLRLIILDGAEAKNAPLAWAAADIFTSLSDNIQETFGLTPIEAMAAGLPCVVSDWDGYKDTIRDGVDGFRVPTYAPSSGCGGDLADRLALGAADYDGYIGEVSLFTAVDVDAAAEAYRRLIVSPDLRRTMGEAGRKRATEFYDWPVIFRRYMVLWEDLAERRRSDPHVPGEESRARRPDQPDPFDLFRTFPTTAISPHTRVRLSTTATADEAMSRKRLKSVGYATAVLPSDPVATQLIVTLGAYPEGIKVGDLQAACKSVPLGGVIRSLAFLAKMAIVEVLSAS